MRKTIKKITSNRQIGKYSKYSIDFPRIFQSIAKLIRDHIFIIFWESYPSNAARHGGEWRFVKIEKNQKLHLVGLKIPERFTFTTCFNKWMSYRSPPTTTNSSTFFNERHSWMDSSNQTQRFWPRWHRSVNNGRFFMIQEKTHYDFFLWADQVMDDSIKMEVETFGEVSLISDGNQSIRNDAQNGKKLMAVSPMKMYASRFANFKLFFIKIPSYGQRTQQTRLSKHWTT